MAGARELKWEAKRVHHYAAEVLGLKQPVSSLKELAEVSQNRNHSKSDITDIWNGFAGEAGAFEDLKTQKAFKNRMYGLQAIWKAIQRLDPSAAPYQDTRTAGCVSIG